MLKVNNKDTRTTPMASPWTYFTPCSSVSIVNFEHLIAGWVCANKWKASALSPFFSFSFWGEDIWDLYVCQMGINGLWRKSQKSAKFYLYCFRERRFLSVNNVDDSYLQGGSFEECFLNALRTTTVLRSLWYKIQPDKSLLMPKQSTI